MAAPPLVFSLPRYAGGPPDLLFGRGEGAVIAPPPASAALQAALPGVAFVGLAVYDNRTPLRLSASAALRQQQAERSGLQNPVRWLPAAPSGQGWPSPWAPAAAGRDAAAAAPWVSSQPLAGQAAARHQQARVLAQQAALRHQSTLARHQQAQARHQQAQAWAATFGARHQRAFFVGRSSLLAIAVALAVQLQATAGFQRAAEARRPWLARWQRARPVPMGISVYLPPSGPATEPRVVSLHLLFACPPYAPGAPLPLRFGRVCRPAALPPRVVIAIRSFYMTINSVTLARLPAGTEFAATAFSLEIDADSWTFGWSASLHSSARPHLLRASPSERVEVLATVNGQALRLVIDSIGRDRRFPEDRLSVRGRGRAAELDEAMLSFGNATARTAQQLMADVLSVNGAPMDWSVDWQIEDWLVPAGAWLHQGTHISALQDIASAAGAYLQPHATDQVLRVLPRYPDAPWRWDALTPDLELPAAVTVMESAEEVRKPAYNRVYLGGVSAGVFGPATRDGSAGDVVAPQVTHALITAEQAHRQRGLAVLSDTGLQQHLTLKTLVLPETGIVMPGNLIRYLGHDGPVLGLVRKTSVSMSQWPAMHQTLGVETHVE